MDPARVDGGQLLAEPSSLSRVTWTVRVLVPPSTTVSVTLSPGRWPRIVATSESDPVTTWSSTLVTTSPRLSPAFWPAEPWLTDSMPAPLSSPFVEDASETETPSRAWVGVWPSRSCWTTGQHLVDRDREPEADRAAGGRVEAAAGRRTDGGVDADHVAVQVHERAAGVAGVDRRVRLDGGVRRVLTALAAGLAARPTPDGSAR